MDIVNILKKIEIYLEKNIQYAGRGGCGLVAYYVSKELIKRNIEFVYQTNSPTIRDNLYTFGHIWIKLIEPEFIFNKEVPGFDTPLEKEYTKRYMYKRLRLSAVYRRGEKYKLWCQLYNPKQNSKMRRAIQYYFKKYDN